MHITLRSNMRDLGKELPLRIPILHGLTRTFLLSLDAPLIIIVLRRLLAAHNENCRQYSLEPKTPRLYLTLQRMQTYEDTVGQRKVLLPMRQIIQFFVRFMLSLYFRHHQTWTWPDCSSNFLASKSLGVREASHPNDITGACSILEVDVT